MPTLPPTLRDIHRIYDIVGMQPSPVDVPVAMAMPKRHTHIGLVMDLILAVLSAESTNFDQHRVYKLFETFAKVGVAGESLKSFYSFAGKLKECIGFVERIEPHKDKSEFGGM